MTSLQDLLDQLDNMKYHMQLALHRGLMEEVERHANEIITIAGEIRRECFLMTHTSGEVK